jgi:putative ABC transport system permease protein
MERTKLIGTLKALGATNWEIMRLFLFESAIIGLVGGILGVCIGLVLCGSVSELGVRVMGLSSGASGMVATVSPELIVFAIGFSVIIGIVSGIFPAKRAANLQPVEALRFE